LLYARPGRNSLNLDTCFPARRPAAPIHASCGAPESDCDESNPAAGRHHSTTANESQMFLDSGPLTRGLIETLLMIGGIESNPGMSQNSDSPGGSGGRHLFTIPPWQEVHESSRPKALDTRVFEEWQLQKSDVGAVTSARSTSQPTQSGMEQPIALGISEEGGPSSSAPPPATGPHPTTQLAPSEAAEVAGRKRATPSRESSSPPIGTTQQTESPNEAAMRHEPTSREPAISKELPSQGERATRSGAHAEVDVDPGNTVLPNLEEPSELELAEFLAERRAQATEGGEAGSAFTRVGDLAFPVNATALEWHGRPHKVTARGARNSRRATGRKRSLDARSPVDDARVHRRTGPTAPAASDEDADEDIEDSSGESESEIEPDSDDLRAMDDSQLSDDDPNVHRAVDETRERGGVPRSVDAAFAGMRLRMGEMRRQEEAPDLDRPSDPELGHSSLVYEAVPEPVVQSDPLTGNEVFKKDDFRVLRVREHGTNCFHQTKANPRGRLPGPKLFMQQEAALLNHEAQVVLHKWSGKVRNGVRISWRSFASYPDWETARSHLEGRHKSVTEIIQHGKPCKPYLDLDGKDGLPLKTKRAQETDGGVEAGHGEGERHTKEEVMGTIEEWAGIVFAACYGHELEKSSFVWIESSGQAKFSLHLTINQLAPRQLVFGSNTGGAAHFARRLKERLRQWHSSIAALIDLNVYTVDREWRTPGSAKVERPESVLSCVDRSRSWKDALVTWLEPLEAREEVKVPFQLPERLHERYKNPRDMSERGTERSSKNEEFVKARMLALLRERLHRTAYEEGPDRFNYSDRSEPCYTGRIHENHQNLTCHLNPNGKIYALCFSNNTEGGDSESPCISRAFYLGDLFEDNVSFEAGAVKVDVQHLKRVPGASTSELLAEVAAGSATADDLMKLNTVANEWIAGKFPLLGIRSGVNTGKTVFCGAVSDELFELVRQASGRPMRTCMITYRGAQAEDLKQRFPRTANYLDLKADYENEWFENPDDKHTLLTALQSRERFPEIVIQVDSLLNLRPGRIGEVPPFDLVILDEVASILAHLSAATLRNGMETGELFLEIVQRATRVLAMDDGYGQREHDFFQLAAVHGKLIINTRRASVPLTFRVCQDERAWLERIVSDLAAGKNVVVVSMSAKVLERIQDRVITQISLTESDILIHKALSGGDNTALLRNVAVNWKVRLLMYSPTVEAGVNFDEDWFHTKFLYMCRKSTTARAAWQATLRVRRTQSSLVHCFVQESISVVLDCAPEIPASCLHTSRQSSTAPAVQTPDPGDESPSQEGNRLDQQVAAGSPLNRASRPHQPAVETANPKQQLKGSFNLPRRVTLAETLQYLQACTTYQTAAWRRVVSRTENSARAVRLIEDGPLFRAYVHTEAERRNSDARLLQDFQLQVARAGHVVEIEQCEEDSEKSAKRRGLDPEAFKIIEANAIDAAEYRRLKRLRDVKRDKGAENLEVIRYEACLYYGLKNLDEHFFKETKAAFKPPFSKQLDFLLKVMVEGRFLDEGTVARKSNEVVMVEAARTLLKDMGLAHPLDVRGETRSLLAGGLRDRLLGSDLFKGRPKRAGAKVAMAERAVSEMFGIHLPAPKEGKAHLDPGQLKTVMNGVLKYMGLKVGKQIEVKRPRRGKGKQNESGSGNSDYKYKLERKYVLRMAKLVKLQFREVPRVWQYRGELSPALREYLDSVDASDLDNLLRRPSGQPLLEDLAAPQVLGDDDIGLCIIVPKDKLPSD
ncbi:hypothetical protein KFL_009560010, partial [Klebsormidium nitens]